MYAYVNMYMHGCNNNNQPVFVYLFQFCLHKEWQVMMMMISCVRFTSFPFHLFTSFFLSLLCMSFTFLFIFKVPLKLNCLESISRTLKFDQGDGATFCRNLLSKIFNLLHNYVFVTTSQSHTNVGQANAFVTICVEKFL